VRSQPEQVLDTCVAQLNEGRDLEAVLAEYPDDADELRPMLAAVALMRFEAPEPVRKSSNKQRLLAAVADRRRRVEAANGIVVEVKAGVPVRELLARAAPDVRPLIVAAWRMYSTPAPKPRPEVMAAGKARIMTMAAARQGRQRSGAAAPGLRLSPRVARGWVGLRRGLLPTPSLGRRAWSGMIATLLTLAVLGVTAAGLGTAAASSLPGDSFYNVKELGRSAQVLFAFDPASRAEVNLRIAEQRLAEMAALARIGRGVPASVVDRWLASQSSALREIQQLPPEQRELLMKRLLAAVGRGQALEDQLQGAIDPEVRDRMLRVSAQLANQARGEAEAASTDKGPKSSTQPAARHLPAEKDISRQPSQAERPQAPMAPVPAAPAQVAAPAAESPAAERSVPQAPQVVQPRDEREDRSASSGGNQKPAENPAPGTAPASEATEPPPAINQPVFEEPTDTSTPEPMPTTQPQLQAPPDLPVEPTTPGP
jgi:hypothetical protein